MSQDRATALQPRRQRATSSQNKTKQQQQQKTVFFNPGSPVYPTEIKCHHISLSVHRLLVLLWWQKAGYEDKAHQQRMAEESREFPLWNSV